MSAVINSTRLQPGDIIVRNRTAAMPARAYLVISVVRQGAMTTTHCVRNGKFVEVSWWADQDLMVIR